MMPRRSARIVRPTKNVPRIAAIQPSVIAALRDSGVRNAGMPFEIASVPVIAVHPEEKARRTRNHVSVSAAGSEGGGVLGKLPVARRKNPSRIMKPNDTTKKYVGTAKIRPDSRTPRMLASAITATHATPSATLCEVSSGNADVTAATPAATDTDTVST